MAPNGSMQMGTIGFLPYSNSNSENYVMEQTLVLQANNMSCHNLFQWSSYLLFFSKREQNVQLNLSVSPLHCGWWGLAVISLTFICMVTTFTKFCIIQCYRSRESQGAGVLHVTCQRRNYEIGSQFFETKGCNSTHLVKQSMAIHHAQPTVASVHLFEHPLDL